MSIDSISHFEFVLLEAEAKKAALQERIAELQRQARELSVTIGGILALAPPELAARFSAAQDAEESKKHRQPSHIPESQRFLSISTRWALLIALDETKEPILIPDL